MKYTLITLLSASMVAAAPAPFVVSGDVAAIGSTTASLGRREAQDFGKRALQLRGALVAAALASAFFWPRAATSAPRS
jgi:hypothetical protein